MSDTKTPNQWAEELVPPRERWKHAMADSLHGWSRHQYEQAEELKLSQADYEAALTAVVNNAEPHEPALSPHAPIVKHREEAEKQQQSADRAADKEAP